MCYRLNRHISLLAKNKKYPKCRKFSTAEVMESIFNEDGKTSFAVNNFFATKGKNLTDRTDELGCKNII